MASANTFVPLEVISDLIDDGKSLVSPLMKLNYFGRLIKNDELIQFTTYELNGYKNVDVEVPEYRRVRGDLIVDVQAGFNKHTLPLSVIMVEERYREFLSHVIVGQGVKTLEELAITIQKNGDQQPQFGRSIPIEMLYAIQPGITKFYKSDARMDAVGARVMANGYVISEVLSAIRSRLLSFTMEIADKFGYDIEISSFRKNQDANNQTIIHYMKTEIKNTGDGVVVNTGDNSKIEANITVNKGDLQSLNKFLESHGVEQEDIEELNGIIQAEQPDYQNKKLGKNTNGWLSKTYDKALNGIGKVSIGAAGNLLATGIKLYFGIDV